MLIGTKQEEINKQAGIQQHLVIDLKQLHSLLFKLKDTKRTNVKIILK